MAWLDPANNSHGKRCHGASNITHACDAANVVEASAHLAACRPRCLTTAQAKQLAQLLYTAWGLGWLHLDLGPTDPFMQDIARQKLVPVLLDLCSVADLRKVVVDEVLWRSLVDASRTQPKRRPRSKHASTQVWQLQG